MNSLYQNLHYLYPVSKTLRFELKPVGRTLENIEKSGILEKDEERADAFKKVKKYCDEYHKLFIERALRNFELDSNLLEEYYNLFKIIRNAKKEQRQTKEFKANQKKLENTENELRKQISNRFTKDDKFKDEYNGLKGKELTDIYLEEMYKDSPEKLTDISEFKNFSTYFSGFRKNRENMYSAEKKSTAISYRLINENLPIFISNMEIYKKIKEKLLDKIDVIYKELNEYIQVNDIDEMFQLEYFNDTLTQTEIEVYNTIITGRAEENKKIKGLNEYINEYNQKQEDKNKRIPKFKVLYKQILSDSDSTSFSIEKIENDKELFNIINDYYKNFENQIQGNEGNLLELLRNINNYNLEKIYLNNDLSLTDISNKVYNNWSKIKMALLDDYDKNYVGKKKNQEQYLEKRDKYFKGKKQISIAEIERCISEENNELDTKLIEYIKNYTINVKDENQKSKNLIDDIKEKYEKFEKIKRICNIENSKELLKKGRKNSKENSDKDNDIEIIKEFLDSLKAFQEFLQPLVPKDNTLDRDSRFYNSFLNYYDNIKGIISVYNKVRNYLTQKPYSNEKIKLNFNNSTLLDGWDINKEQDYLGTIFVKNNNYYLGIIDKSSKKIFENFKANIDKEKNYKKMRYKLLPTPNKMLPKVFFSEKGIEHYKPSEEILSKYKAGCYKKGDNFDLEFCHKLIDFYKNAINKNDDWTCFQFEFKDTNQYNDISEFYSDVEEQGYKIILQDIDEDYINDLLNNGKLYLFQIYNKDFSKYSKGNKNLHTLYWKEIFDEENLKKSIYKLNGGAEVFYRKKSLNLDDTAHHEANKPIKNKNPKTIENGKETSTFDYELIKDRRYTVDKFQFHVPITLNFNNKGISNINEIVNKYLKENDDNYVIGIDRGERNLVYISLINSKQEIIKQKSLNIIKNEHNETDYHDLLDRKEQEMNQAKKSWKTIENIKELKEGYLSQVIHEIVTLMEEYNAIIVLEDLNMGFKNSRAKVEKQVYQKFEKMLIDKLNYLVSKNKSNEEAGGLLNAYQLTNKFESFRKMGKQSGVLFYIPAWNTSKIDPTTGFVNLFNSAIIEKTKDLVEKIDDIRFNEKEDYYEFDIDYSKYPCKLHNSKSKWTLCSVGKRIITFRDPEKNNEWNYNTIDLTKEFNKLFNIYKIDKNSIKQDILNNADKKFFDAKKTKDGFYGFKYLFKYMIQMRNSNNSNSKEEEVKDYLISPVKNADGNFFKTDKENEILPKDADANGAYNIARKGLMVIKQIKETDDSKLKNVKFDITNESWLKFAQGEK